MKRALRLAALCAVIALGGGAFALGGALRSGCARPAAKSDRPAPATRERAVTAASSRSSEPATKDEGAAEYAEIVRLEGARELANGRLVALANAGEGRLRARAIFALGRVGGAEARAVLRALLADPEPRLRVVAIDALGLTGAPEAAGALLDLLAAAGPSGNLDFATATLRTLGRVGDAHAARAMTASLASPDSPTRSAAALALGALGRRKVVIGAEARAALIGLVGDRAQSVRYGVAYALLREVPRTIDRSVEQALITLSADSDDEIRALAVRALAERGMKKDALLVAALDDADWRVRVQAVRGLAERGPRARKRLAEFAADEWAVLAQDEALLASPRIHPVLEAYDKLASHASQVVGLLGRPVAATATGAGRLAADLVACRAAALRARAGAGTLAEVATCSSGTWSPREAERLALALVAEKAGKPRARAALVMAHARSTDAAVRGAAAAAAVSLVGKGAADDDDDDDNDDDAGATGAAAQGVVLAALTESDAIVLGFVTEAIATRADRGRVPASWLGALRARASDAALPVDVRLGLIDALCRAKDRSAESVLRAAHAGSVTAVAERARECWQSLSGEDLGPRAAGPMPLPPVTPAPTPQPVRLVVETTRGRVAIELSPYFAPWSAAVLTAVARSGAYDGTSWHRVVADFVVQGGDPTGTGMGGPGYLVPAEPSAQRYLRGTVGIADSGPDTGGSQFFVMHSAAPHLEGRYTIVGQVVKGLEVIDLLIPGDRIVSVTVE